jgi:hypothetical protein
MRYSVSINHINAKLSKHLGNSRFTAAAAARNTKNNHISAPLYQMFSICQSIGSLPIVSSILFAALKCPHPKNPRLADNGLG